MAKRGPKNGHHHTGMGYQSPTYRTWRKMLNRCRLESVHNFDKYGGRGITVCVRWQIDFKNFLADMGERPEGTTLDRKDNDGPYCKDNCRWATHKEQQRNTSKTKYVTLHGVTRPFLEWCEIKNRKPSIVRQRLAAGWHPVLALFTPT